MITTSQKIELSHDDGWSFEVEANETETMVRYFEYNYDSNVNVEKNVERYTAYEGFDKKLASAILKVRAMYDEDNND